MKFYLSQMQTPRQGRLIGIIDPENNNALGPLPTQPLTGRIM